MTKKIFLYITAKYLSKSLLVLKIYVYLQPDKQNKQNYDKYSIYSMVVALLKIQEVVSNTAYA